MNITKTRSYKKKTIGRPLKLTATHPTSAGTVLMYINLTPQYEHMLCTAKQLLGVADALEGLTCRI
jgi:hypothetical protein